MTTLLDFPPLWFALAALVVLLVMVPCGRWLDGRWTHHQPRVTVTAEPARQPRPAPASVTPLRVRAERIDQVAS